jgi:hypothetical protein
MKYWLFALPLLTACGKLTPAEPDKAGYPPGGQGSDAAAVGDADLRPTVIATGVEEPVHLASDGTTLFFSTGDSQASLYSVSVNGGTPALQAQNAMLIGLDEANVYYQSVYPLGTLYAQSKVSTGMRTQLNPGVPGQPATAATVYDDVLYWTEPDPSREYFDLYSYRNQGAVTAEGRVYTPQLGSPMLLGPTRSMLFYASSPMAGVQVAPLGQGSATPVLPGTLNWAMTSDELAAYICPANATPVGSLVRVVADGTTTTLTSKFVAVQNSGSIAVDDTFVYWAAAGNTSSATTTPITGGVMRTPKLGGATVALSNDSNPNALTVDATAIYWEAGGDIKRLVK